VPAHRKFTERDLADTGERLKDMLLTRGFEIQCDCLLERRFILLNEASYAVKLLDPPLIAPRRARREAELLPVK
jgi:hypothetical protein